MPNLVVYAATPTIAQEIASRVSRATAIPASVAMGSSWMPSEPDTRLVLCRDHFAAPRVTAVKTAIRGLPRSRVVVVDQFEENWDRVARDLFPPEVAPAPPPSAPPVVAPRRGLLSNGRLPVLVVQSYATSLWANSMAPKLVKRGFDIVNMVSLDEVHDKDEWPEYGQAAVLVMYSPMPSGVKLPPKRDDMPVLFLPHKASAWDLSPLATRGLLPHPDDEHAEMPAPVDEPDLQPDVDPDPPWVAALTQEAEGLRADVARLTDEKNEVEIAVLLAEEKAAIAEKAAAAGAAELASAQDQLLELAETNAALEAKWLTASGTLNEEHTVSLTPNVTMTGTWPTLVNNMRQQLLNQGAEVLALRERAERAEKAVLSVPPPTPSSTLARLNGEIARLKTDLERAVAAKDDAAVARDAARSERDQARGLLQERLHEVTRLQNDLDRARAALLEYQQGSAETARKVEASWNSRFLEATRRHEDAARALQQRATELEELRTDSAEQLREQILAREAAERELSLALHDLKAARAALKVAEAPAPTGLPADTRANVEGVFALNASGLLDAQAALDLLRRAFRV